MRRIFIAILCAILMPAAVAAEPAPAAKSSAKKKGPPASTASDTRESVGIVSNIGDQFTVQEIGITAFGNEKRAEPIESWGMDALVTAKASAAVQARFKAVPVKLSPAARAALVPPAFTLFGRSSEHVCDVLRKETAGQSFKYYLWVLPGDSAYGATNQSVRGLGIVHQGGVGGGKTYVHAIFDVEILDGRTCESIRREIPPTTEGGFFTNIHGPAQEVDGSWMPAPSTVAQNARLKDTVRSLAGNGLAATLPKLLAPRQQ